MVAALLVGIRFLLRKFQVKRQFLNLPVVSGVLLALFLFMEFAFYLWNLIGGGLRGPGWFFHLSDSDPILWVVFFIGYINLFTSGYFLFLLWRNRQIWRKSPNSRWW